MRNHAAVCVILIVALGFSAFLCGQTGSAASGTKVKPGINITVVPPWDQGGPDKMAKIAGTVSRTPNDCRIVIFALGDVWYVQPFTAWPFTSISKDGTWYNDTHLGREYAAMLVTSDYLPPNRTNELPREGGAILAIARVRGK